MSAEVGHSVGDPFTASVEANAATAAPRRKLRWGLRRYTDADVQADGGYDAAPPQAMPYSRPNGSLLERFGRVDVDSKSVDGVEVKRKVIHWYTPWTVAAHDTLCLLAFIEVDDEEREFEIAVCRSKEVVVESFIKHFSSDRVLRPLDPQQIVRLCVCPMHRKVSLLDPIDDVIVSAVALGHPRGSSESDEYRLVLQHKGKGFVRFFDTHLSPTCLCHAPVAYLP